MRTITPALVLALAALSWTPTASAQESPQEAPEPQPVDSAAEEAPAADDAAAPSLEVPTDPEIPYWSLGVSTDPLGMFFGEFGVRFEGTLGAVQSIAVEPAYLHLDDADALGLELAYHVWPFAQGLHGLYLGPALGVSVTTDRALTGAVSLELGYQYVWDGIVLGAAGGATWSRSLTQPGGWTLSPRAQVTLGWAWM